jgi:hypothetical protein
MTMVTGLTERWAFTHPRRCSVAPAIERDEICVERHDRLGGLLHEYVPAA